MLEKLDWRTGPGSEVQIFFTLMHTAMAHCPGPLPQVELWAVCLLQGAEPAWHKLEEADTEDKNTLGPRVGPKGALRRRQALAIVQSVKSSSTLGRKL